MKGNPQNPPHRHIFQIDWRVQFVLLSVISRYLLCINWHSQKILLHEHIYNFDR